MAVVDEVAVKLGLKTAEFRSALKGANADVQKFKKDGTIGENEGLFGSLRKMTQQISQFRAVLLGGGIVAALRSVFQSAITYAENYTGAFDEGVAATLRLRNAVKELQTEFGSAAANSISFLERVRLIYLTVTRGAKAGVQAARESAVANAKAFSDEQVKKLADAMANLSRVRLQAALAAASTSEKVNILEEELARQLKEQEKVRGNIVEFLKQQAEIEKTLADIAEAKRDVEKQEAEYAEAREKFRQQRAEDAEEASKRATAEAQKRQAAAEKEAAAQEKVANAYERMVNAQNALDSAEGDRGRSSLDDISKGGGGTTQTNKARAKEVLRLEAAGKRAAAGGFGDIAARRFAAADALRKKLAPVLNSGEVDPLQKWRDHLLKDSRDYLREIHESLKPTDVDE